MFYANSAPEIRSQNTVLNPRQVFVGDYWDEFALPLFFIPDSANVLLLGLARGGGVRPLLSSEKRIAITALDSDSATNKACRKYFSDHFSDLKFEIEQSCALQYLQENQKNYDAVWVDVYLPDSYWGGLYDDGFWQSLKQSLHSESLVFINSFGLPIQFSPLTNSSVQKNLVEKLKKHFPYVAYLPHRRNLTLVAGLRAPEWRATEANNQLNRIDKESFRCIGLKAKHLTEVSVLSRKEFEGGGALSSLEDLKFTSIDQQMLAKWDEVIKDVNRLGFAVRERIELLNLIRQTEFIDVYAQRGQEELRLFIPVLAAGQSRLMNLNLDNLFSWFFVQFELLKEQSEQQFYQVWLPQMWNLLIGSEQRYLSHFFQLSNRLKM